MRQLLPYLEEPVDPALVYADLPVVSGRPAVRLNMIASVDGATAVDGRSGGLGGPADQRVFGILRKAADVVLVGAGTVRAEGYGPATVPIAVVTRSCRLDFDAPLFTANPVRPLLITVAQANADRVQRAAEVADVIFAGDSGVDLRRALAELGSRGYASVLAEGGPMLNAQLAASGLVDELCLTLSPQLVGGGSSRILSGPPLDLPVKMAPVSVCEEEGFLFLRLRPSTP